MKIGVSLSGIICNFFFFFNFHNYCSALYRLSGESTKPWLSKLFYLKINWNGVSYISRMFRGFCCQVSVSGQVEIKPVCACISKNS